MENNSSKLTYMVKSYSSEKAIQSWINSRKKDRYKQFSLTLNMIM